MEEEKKQPESENGTQIILRKPIPNMGEYEIDINGTVYRNNHKLKATNNTKGYKQIRLSINGVVKGYLIHRLVAVTFIPNPENKPYVDHIDANCINNNVNNLRWCTAEENNNNPITKQRVGLSKSGDKCTFYGKKGKDCPHSKILFQFKDGIIIDIFDCISNACDKYGYNHSLITRCCQNKINIAYGYNWEYGYEYFIELIRQMRHNQRRYLNTRKPEVLETCKKLEKQVDELVAKMFDTQMNLF